MATFRLLVLLAPAAAVAQDAGWPQFSPGSEPPALTNPKLGQRTTLLGNNPYAVFASGVTHGAIWLAEHPTAASLERARHLRRKGQSTPRTGCRHLIKHSSLTTAAAAKTAAT